MMMRIVVRALTVELLDLPTSYVIDVVNSQAVNNADVTCPSIVYSLGQGRAGNMVKYTPGVLFLYIFMKDISRAPLQKKNTQPFQALNGLKCSTVGNLGSWAFVIMLLGFTHFFGVQSQKRSKFSYIEQF